LNYLFFKVNKKIPSNTMKPNWEKINWNGMKRNEREEKELKSYIK
jgi:hypothetical protein